MPISSNLRLLAGSACRGKLFSLKGQHIGQESAKQMVDALQDYKTLVRNYPSSQWRKQKAIDIKDTTAALADWDALTHPSSQVRQHLDAFIKAEEQHIKAVNNKSFFYPFKVVKTFFTRQSAREALNQAERDYQKVPQKYEDAMSQTQKIMRFGYEQSKQIQKFYQSTVMRFSQ